jgi:hypothetical protein
MPDVFVRCFCPLPCRARCGKLISLLRLRKREVDEGTEVATYPIDAVYHTLVGHCESEHEVALNVLARMTPSEIAAMHQRLQGALPAW